ncbi:MAG: epimerase [Ignavibacteria bacterium]|nr:epimerase [Ignavibacteria bacterium]
MIRAIITGSTGMVGEGVLHVCLNDKRVEKILLINRKSLGIVHPKVKELVINSYEALSEHKDEFNGYNACYHCMGVTSVGKTEQQYSYITYDLTMLLGRLLSSISNDMVFCYVTGAGTDNTGSGKSMWARIKGKTENELLKLPFNAAYMFRPAYIQPIKGLKNTYKFYKILIPLYPIIQKLMPNYTCSLEEIGKAMINVTSTPYTTNILECSDIRQVTK